MNHTNRMARQWLIANKYDYIWFKPHRDLRKKSNVEWYWHDGTMIQQTDLWNLFDGICIDRSGTITFIQTTTTNYHPEDPYREFMKGKNGFHIIMIRAVKKKNRWHIQTKEIA